MTLSKSRRLAGFLFENEKIRVYINAELLSVAFQTIRYDFMS